MNGLAFVLLINGFGFGSLDEGFVTSGFGSSGFFALPKRPPSAGF
jgi:hypothetical protein